MKTLKIKDEVHEKLLGIKLSWKAKNCSEVIDELIEQWRVGRIIQGYDKSKK